MEKSTSTAARLIGRRPSSLRTRTWRWLVVDGNRILLAGLLLVTAYWVFLMLDYVGVIAFENADSMTRLLGGTIAGVLSLITIVLAINQLVMNRELGNAGETMDRLHGALDLKREVEEMSDPMIGPVEPMDFLELIVADIGHQVDAIDDCVRDADSDERVDVDAFVDHVRTQTNRMEEALAEVEFSSYNQVLVDLHHETTWLLFVARRFQQYHDDAVSDEVDSTFDDLLESLELFHVSQNYFKTTYMQRELTHVSRVILLVGIPAVFAAYLAGLIYAGADGATIPTTLLSPVVAGLLTVALSPLALFSAYILRTATLVRQTAHVGPFTSERW